MFFCFVFVLACVPCSLAFVGVVSPLRHACHIFVYRKREEKTHDDMQEAMEWADGQIFELNGFVFTHRLGYYFMIEGVTLRTAGLEFWASIRCGQISVTKTGERIGSTDDGLDWIGLDWTWTLLHRGTFRSHNTKMCHSICMSTNTKLMISSIRDQSNTM